MALRLPWKVQAAAMGLPLVVLLPLLHGNRLLAPTDGPILANLPDAPRVADPDIAHGVFNDAILQLLPWEAEVRRGFSAGHLPLWSDLLDGGSSPWVNPQAAVLSPIAMLGRLLPLEHFLLGTLAVKILLAFEGCWLLARVLGARRFTAALGAGAFALGGPIMAWAVFPLSSVVAWSPWLALGTVRVIRKPLPREVAAAALVFAALLLSGHPEIALAECLVAAGFGMIAWRRRGRALRRLAGAALAAILGASLAACSLLPFLLVAPHSLRASHAAEVIAAPRSPRSPRATTAPAPAFNWFPAGQERLLLTALNPWSFGRPFHETFSGPGNWPIAAGGYLGLAALAGAASALVCRRWKIAWPLAALALGMLLLTAGFYPLRRLVSTLPFGRALALDRFLPAAALPLAVLAALGLDELLRSARPARPARPKWPAWPAWPSWLSWLSPSLALLAAGASLLVRHDPPLGALWLLIALSVLLARRRRSWGISLLALAALLDLASWDRDVLPRGHRELFYPQTPLVAAVAGGAAAGGGPWRAAAGGFAVYPSLLPMYGIAEVRVDNPLALGEQLRPLGEIFDFRPEGRRYKSAFRHLEHPFLDFLNVRVIVLAESDAAPPRFELIGGDPPLRVFRNPAALPRWFLPVGAEVRDRRDVLAGIRAIRDPRRVVLAREEVGRWRAPERPWSLEAVRLLRERPGAVSLALPPAGEKLLATSLPFPAGWTASAAGRALRRITVNSAYLGLVVPPGVSEVDLSFAPPGFGLGMVLSALAAAAVAMLAALSRAKRPGV